MEFFTQDYLMHYGVKGMKWKKRKAGENDIRETDTGTGKRVTDMDRAMSIYRGRLSDANRIHGFYRSAALATGDHQHYNKVATNEEGRNWSTIEARERKKRAKSIRLRKQKARMNAALAKARARTSRPSSEGNNRPMPRPKTVTSSGAGVSVRKNSKYRPTPRRKFVTNSSSGVYLREY